LIEISFVDRKVGWDECRIDGLYLKSNRKGIVLKNKKELR
jgi:hypothetical protein